MINKTLMSTMTVMSCILVLLASTFSTDADARYTKRSDRWESTFKVVHSTDVEWDGNGGSSLDMKSDYGWGFTLGYNLNPHITLNYDFSSTTPSYTADVVIDTNNVVAGIDDVTVPFQAKMDVYNSQFNINYNVLASQFTPYVQAGVGWSYMDSNIAQGPPVIGCWWTWYGQLCDGYQPTYDDTNFTYNLAVGVRFEMNNGLLLRASYKQDWIDISHAPDATIGSYVFEIGSTF